MIKTKRGLDLPISGRPAQSITSGPPIRTVALMGYDYPGLKPTMEVAVGDQVALGQLVLTDKKTPGVKYTSPASGTVAAINRGHKRVFESLVIDVSGDAEITFDKYDPAQIASLDRDKVVTNLVESGEWTAIRTRPYGKVPAPEDTTSVIFVNAADTRPLAPDPALHINEHASAYLRGIDALACLAEAEVHVCGMAGASLPLSENPKVHHHEFAGPHPAGNVGTHIHFVHPVHTNRHVWYVGYQDVIAIGYLFLTGRIYLDRVVSIAGPGVSNPRVVRTRMGASTDELVAGELKQELGPESAPGNHRVISGSVLDGRRAAGATAHLGRFHNQVSALGEGTERELLAFVMPGSNKFSLTRLFTSAFMGTRAFDMSTSTHGSARSIIPLGTYEEVMPLDILPTQLLRALVVDDFDAAVSLGALELEEEDVALCTFACPGKYEYGPYLRRMLTRIEAES